MSAIVINQLTKKVGKRKLFSDLNMEVLEGEMFALLSLDQDVKMTFSKILFNYTRVSKGSISIFGMDSVKDSKAIKESVSLVPAELSFEDKTRAISLFKKTLAFHNLKNTDEIETLSEYFEFNNKLKISDMNENEKKLFSIINALIVKPRLLVLDEPSKNLSSSQVAKLFEYLNRLKTDEGLTVLVLTDSLFEAQMNCDRAAYLYEGSIEAVEYLNDKVANDKILRIYSDFAYVSRLSSIGATVIKSDARETVFYYDKDLRLLSNVVAECGIENYSIENSSLKDKIDACFISKNRGGVL